MQLYDPSRRGTWLDQLRPGEFPVFLRDRNTSAERNAEGRPLAPGEAGVCIVFPSESEAIQFCRQKISEMPQLCCDIYDREGLARPPLHSFGSREWNPAPRTLMLLASGSIVVSIPLFWLDWSHRGEIVLASIVGINLVFLGVRFLFWGFGAYDARREQAKRAS